MELRNRGGGGGLRGRLAHLRSAETYLECVHDGFAQNGKNIQVQALSFS